MVVVGLVQEKKEGREGLPGPALAVVAALLPPAAVADFSHFTLLFRTVDNGSAREGTEGEEDCWLLFKLV